MEYKNEMPTGCGWCSDVSDIDWMMGLGEWEELEGDTEKDAVN